MVNAENNSTVESSSAAKRWLVDATGLNCPLPLLKMKQALNRAVVGDSVIVSATDPASQKDITAYISNTPHQLTCDKKAKLFTFQIIKCK